MNASVSLNAIRFFVAAALVIVAPGAAVAQDNPASPRDPHEAADPHGGSDPRGGGDPHGRAGSGGSMPGMPRLQPLPESVAEEAPGLPAGVLLVRVVDASGDPVPDVLVHLGQMREGERQSGFDVRTRPDGVAQFERLETGTNVSYRAVVEHRGARFSSTPFMMPSNTGFRAQIVRFDVETQPRAVIIANARTEISFRDDRLVVVHRLDVVNFSNVSVDGGPARPFAFVAGDGAVQIRLPPGFLAFNAQEQMGDLRVTEENGYAVLRGSVPPTGGRDPVQVVFQYHLRIRDTAVEIAARFPLQVLRSTVAIEAPPGLTMNVEGMGDSQSREHNGQHFLVAGRERESREDAPLNDLVVRIAGIPSVAGPERMAAAIAAAICVLVALGLGIQRRRTLGASASPDTTARRRKSLEHERDRLVAELRAAADAHAAGDVGPESWQRLRRETTVALARVLRELGA